jgi:hypothetical protein
VKVVALVAAAISASSSAAVAASSCVARSSSGSGEAAKSSGCGAVAGGCSAGELLPLPLGGLLVHAQRAGEGLDRRQQALLQAGQEEARGALQRLGRVLESFLAQFAVLVEQSRELQLGGVGRQAGDRDLRRLAAWEATLQLAQVFLEAADQHSSQVALGDRHAADEALRVEDFEQGRERVAVAVVRRGRQEQAVFEVGARGRAWPS